MAFLTAQHGRRFGWAEHARHGPVFKTYLLGRKTVVVSDPQLARKIFTGEHELVESE